MKAQIKQFTRLQDIKPRKFALFLLGLLVIAAVIGGVYTLLKPEEKPPVSEGTTSAEIEDLRKTDFNKLPEPERYVEYLRLGTLYEEGGDLKQASDTYILASKLTPAKTDFTVWQSLVRVVSQTDEADPDIKTYGEKIVSIISGKKKKLAADYITMAEGYEAMGDKNNAVKQYKVFLAKAEFKDANPDDPEPVGSNVYPTTYKTQIETKIQQLEQAQ